MKRQNPTFGCLKVAQEIAHAFGVEINKDVLRRILEKHYGPTSNNDGPSWLTTLGHIKDSLWSMGPSDGDDANEIRAAGPLRMAGSGDHDISVSHITQRLGRGDGECDPGLVRALAFTEDR